MEEIDLYFTRFEMINAILSAQDNGDKEYYDLMRIYQKNTQDSETFIKSFLVTDLELADYIKSSYFAT